jgi:hypothetical protein
VNSRLTLLLVTIVVSISGCVTGGPGVSQLRSHTDTSAVRKVDYSRAPHMKAMAEHSRQFASRMYPQVLAVLGEDGSKPPRRFSIVFAKRLRRGHGAETRLSTIYVNVEALNGIRGLLDRYASDSSATNVELMMRHTLEAALVHEMAHVAQPYATSWYSWLPMYRKKVPVWWVEGVAYYVGGKLGYSIGLDCPGCLWWHDYVSDGWCAAAFLLYLDATYGADVIQQLHIQLGRRAYHDRFFDATTGNSLKQLWADFKKTPAFIAPEPAVLELEQSLGYIDHKPPKDIDSRSAGRVEAARSTAYLRRQPGGALTAAAIDFLEALKRQDQLPGWRKDDEGDSLITVDAFGARGETHPVVRTIHAQKKGDQTMYHYRVVQDSKDSRWTLQRAWRTDKDGQTLADDPIP